MAVVTLVSPLGEYGGPLRVAVNQSKALAECGHDVTIAGAYRGFDCAPRDIEGVPTKLFPARKVIPRSGFAGLAAPGLWAWLAGAAREFDVAHVHAARDLVTLPAARIAGQRRLRYVVQSHGMIDQSDRAMAKPLDVALTLPVLKGAHRVFYLTDREQSDLTKIAAAAELRLAELPNGVPETNLLASRNFEDPEVLYLARIAARKRPTLFVSAARQLASTFPNARFSLVGPDEGEGQQVSDQICDAQAHGTPVSWEGAISPGDTLERMSQASVYVLPSVDEPYPMSVLEAMSVGLPVVITESCGLAGFVRAAGAGVVVGHDEASLVEAVGTLLADPDAGVAMGERGRQAVRVDRSMAAIAKLLQDVYESD